MSPGTSETPAISAGVACLVTGASRYLGTDSYQPAFFLTIKNLVYQNPQTLNARQA